MHSQVIIKTVVIEPAQVPLDPAKLRTSSVIKVEQSCSPTAAEPEAVQKQESLIIQ